MDKLIDFFKNIQEAPYGVRVIYHRVSFVVFGFLFLLISINIISGQINQVVKESGKFVMENANNVNLTPLDSLKEDAGALKSSAASIFSGLEAKENKADYFEVVNDQDVNNLIQENNLNNDNNSALKMINGLPVEEY